MKLKNKHLLPNVVITDIKNINCTKQEEEEFLDIFKSTIGYALPSKNNIFYTPLIAIQTGEKGELIIERFRADETNKSCEEIENFDYYIGKFRFDTDKSLKVQVIASDSITGKGTLYQN